MFLYLFEKNMSQSQYLENKKLFTKTDIFLASYPRSGNTWMRLLLSDAIYSYKVFRLLLEVL